MTLENQFRGALLALARVDEMKTASLITLSAFDATLNEVRGGKYREELGDDPDENEMVGFAGLRTMGNLEVLFTQEFGLPANAAETISRAVRELVPRVAAERRAQMN